MGIVEIFLVAVSLCFDTLAVSIIGGACCGGLPLAKRMKIYLSFAFVQAGFTFIGWALGASVSQYIERFDHWIAFLLLLYIGGKMIVESFSKDDAKQSVDLLDTRKLMVSAVATSIDALAVGISFAMASLRLLNILYASLIIGIVTALASVAGLRGGEKLGKLLGNRCNLVGGVILVAIGVKILLEHLL